MESLDKPKDPLVVEGSAESEESSIYDETIIPDEFITPHVAEGKNIHTLKAGNFEMPVSFQVKEGRFGISGILPETGKGGIISGRILGKEAKINHLKLDEELRDSGKQFKGVADALLTDLESNLNAEGVATIHAAFFTPGTVRFLLRNGYNIVPVTSLSEDTKIGLKFNPTNLDSRIGSIDDFENGKDRIDPHQILLVKNIQQSTDGRTSDIQAEGLKEGDAEEIARVRSELGI
ncbi:MAG: hypothetical protein V4509_02310 [Patescibacteria group bacterium]